MGSEMAVLRNQRPQDRHELSCTDVLHLDDLGHDVVVASGAARADRAGELPRGRIGYDLDDVAGS